MEIPTTNRQTDVNLFQWVKRHLQNREQIEDYIIQKTGQLAILDVLGAKKETTDINEETDTMEETNSPIFKWTKNILYSEDEPLKDYIAQAAARCITLELITREPIQSNLN